MKDLKFTNYSYNIAKNYKLIPQRMYYYSCITCEFSMLGLNREKYPKSSEPPTSSSVDACHRTAHRCMFTHYCRPLRRRRRQRTSSLLQAPCGSTYYRGPRFYRGDIRYPFLPRKRNIKIMKFMNVLYRDER